VESRPLSGLHRFLDLCPVQGLTYDRDDKSIGLYRHAPLDLYATVHEHNESYALSCLSAVIESAVQKELPFQRI
jgi:hypothetical protein